MKIDPHNHERKYRGWQEKTKEGIPGISKQNSDIIKKFMSDMEFGRNVSVHSKRGSRSFIRLNTLRDKLMFFARHFESLYGLKCITDITEEQVHAFFADMRSGKIKKIDGSIYKSPGYFVKNFKSFWHWYMLIENKKGNEITNITIYLDTKVDKPRWVYLTEEQVKILCNRAKYKYKVLMMFLYDSGIRAPTELVNIKVSDFYEDFKKLYIRESKTFSRKINLMLCSKLIKEYIKEEGLTEKDYLFNISPPYVNRYLRDLAKRVLGDGLSPAGEKFSNLTLYDFRHSSACYWLPRYKSESSLKYRFGWKKTEQIHYYTELLGMKDDIKEEDLLIDESKTEIQKRLDKSEKENDILKEKISTMESQMQRILANVEKMIGKVN